MSLKLIALTGPAGSGKDTAADHLVENHGFVKVSFAEAMKEGVKTMFGLDDEHVYGNKKEEIIPELGVSPRYILQTLGTDWGREMLHPDIWIAAVNKKWYDMKFAEIAGDSNGTGMVISDLRFENEADWVRRQGGIVVHISPVGNHSSINGSDHKSECGIERKAGDYGITNCHGGDEKLEAFLMKVETIMKGCKVAHPLKIEQKEFKQEFHDQHGMTSVTISGDGMVHVGNPISFRGELVEFKLDEPINMVSVESGGERWVKEERSVEYLQKSIADWADEQFPERTITNALSKLVMEEIPEYLTSQHDPMELADIAILVFDIAHLAGIDLEEAVNMKMAINKQRQWTIDKETGLMKHVK